MKYLCILTIASTILFSNAQAHNSGSHGEKSPSLKVVMQGINNAMIDLTRGIFIEDYKLIANSAHNVGFHPAPKTQLPTVIKTLGKRMSIFKKIDGKVHGSAVEIKKLAGKKDMPGILKNYRVIMNNCVSCHSQFRTEISSALSKL